MATQVIKVDTLQTRIFQSFVNLTESNSTKYPATTSVQIDNTINPPLTTYFVYDTFAFRVSSF